MAAQAEDSAATDLGSSSPEATPAAGAPQRRRRPRLSRGVAIVVATLIVIGATFLFINQEPSLAAVREFEAVPSHTKERVDYRQNPPVGGAHSPVWLNCGVYEQPVKSENAVHSMEHGAVWVTYRPDLPAEDVDALRRAMPDTYAILSPLPGIPSPVVASAWGRQLELRGAEDQRLPAFIREFRQGPLTLEPGGPCTGGTSGGPR